MGRFKNGVEFGAFGSMKIGENHFVSAIFPECSQCGRKEGFPCPPNAPAELARKRPQKRGWQFVDGGRRALCPKCWRERHCAPAERGKVRVLNNVTPIKQELKPNVDYRLELKIAAAIENEWNEKVGCYSDGVTDESIGKEFGVAWGIVKLIREKLGREIKGDPEIVRLEGALTKILDQAASLESEITKLKRQRGLIK